MKKVLVMTMLVGTLLAPSANAKQPPDVMLLGQGCDVFDIVEDLGTYFTPLGMAGRWTMLQLRTGREVVYAFDGVDLVPPPSDDPTKFSGTQFVAWRLEGTGIRGTNQTDYYGEVIDQDFNATGFFQGDTFRGNLYKSGGISGTFSGNLATGDIDPYEEVRMILCKAGFGGGGND